MQIESVPDKYPPFYEILRYLLIGGLATLINFFVMALVLYFFNPGLYDYTFYKVVFNQGLTPLIIATVIGTAAGFCAGVTFNYIFSVLFVFKNSKYARNLKGFLLFVFFASMGLAINALGMYIGYDFLGINEWLVKITLTVLVLVLNYLTRKLIIFRPKTENLQE